MKINTDTRYRNKTNYYSKLILLFLSLLVSKYNYSQILIFDKRVDDKNIVFEALKVKEEKLNEKVMSIKDSTLKSERYIIRHFDSAGLVFKKEEINFKQDTTKTVFDYQRNKSGLCTIMLINDEVRWLREYDDSGNLVLVERYEKFKLNLKSLYKYDSYGNCIAYIDENSSGKFDTICVTTYEYDFSFSPPKIKKEIYLYNHLNSEEKTIDEYDSMGRCIKSITKYYSDNSEDSLFYYYNEKNLLDSTIRFYSSFSEKLIQEYDEHWRLIKMIDYNYKYSTQYVSNFYYDDRIYFMIDSIYNSKNMDLPFENEYNFGALKSMLTYKGKELLNQTTNEYYSNGLMKKETRIIYSSDRIEEKYYEYEFY